MRGDFGTFRKYHASLRDGFGTFRNHHASLRDGFGTSENTTQACEMISEISEGTMRA
ncbi:MAG: hypothetical protein K9H65_05845 [Bacteroidales bacterium]|nr:hypothetical protein [Bacteroidales bacterium]